jgi:hypothetical protein
MEFDITFYMHVNGETLPDDVIDALTARGIIPKGAADRHTFGTPLTTSVSLSYDLFDGPEEALDYYGWTHIAGTHWVSPDGILFSVRSF